MSKVNFTREDNEQVGYRLFGRNENGTAMITKSYKYTKRGAKSHNPATYRVEYAAEGSGVKEADSLISRDVLRAGSSGRE